MVASRLLSGSSRTPKDRLQITPPPLLRHGPLELQETGMLEKHQHKATHQRIVERIAQLLGGTRVFHLAESGRQEIGNRFSGETREGPHPYSLAKRKNSRAPTPSFQAFPYNRKLLG